MSAPRVAVVGDVMLDMVVQPTGAISPASDTPSHVRVTRGGAGANLAVALVASGCEAVSSAPPVMMRRVRSSSTHLTPRASRHTSSASPRRPGPWSRSSTTGQRSMLTDRGANSMLSEPFVLDQLPPL